MTSRLGLGTAQFGLDYGITNATGRVRPDDVRAILDVAIAAGIRVIDTAPSYGASEAALGEGIGEPGAFRIVTKTPKFADLQSTSDARNRLRAVAAHSLQALHVRVLAGLLIHDADDLLGPFGDDLWHEMSRLRDDGVVAKIGVSVYDGIQIDRLLDRYPLDIVQLPFNPLDRRLIDGGQLARLRSLQVEVHARSLFLQGLLLQPAGRIPQHFSPLARCVEEMDEQFAGAGMSRLEGILATCFACSAISCFVCGVTTAAELQAIVSAGEKSERAARTFRLESARNLDVRLLNPARWSELGQAVRS